MSNTNYKTNKKLSKFFNEEKQPRKRVHALLEYLKIASKEEERELFSDVYPTIYNVINSAFNKYEQLKVNNWKQEASTAGLMGSFQRKKVIMYEDWIDLFDLINRLMDSCQDLIEKGWQNNGFLLIFQKILHPENKQEFRIEGLKLLLRFIQILKQENGQHTQILVAAPLMNQIIANDPVLGRERFLSLPGQLVWNTEVTQSFKADRLSTEEDSLEIIRLIFFFAFDKNMYIKIGQNRFQQSSGAPSPTESHEKRKTFSIRQLSRGRSQGSSKHDLKSSSDNYDDKNNKKKTTPPSPSKNKNNNNDNNNDNITKPVAPPPPPPQALTIKINEIETNNNNNNNNDNKRDDSFDFSRESSIRMTDTSLLNYQGAMTEEYDPKDDHMRQTVYRMNLDQLNSEDQDVLNHFRFWYHILLKHFLALYFSDAGVKVGLIEDKSKGFKVCPLSIQLILEEWFGVICQHPTFAEIVWSDDQSVAIIESMLNQRFTFHYSYDGSGVELINRSVILYHRFILGDIYISEHMKNNMTYYYNLFIEHIKLLFGIRKGELDPEVHASIISSSLSLIHQEMSNPLTEQTWQHQTAMEKTSGNVVQLLFHLALLMEDCFDISAHGQLVKYFSNWLSIDNWKRNNLGLSILQEWKNQLIAASKAIYFFLDQVEKPLNEQLKRAKEKFESDFPEEDDDDDDDDNNNNKKNVPSLKSKGFIPGARWVPDLLSWLDIKDAEGAFMVFDRILHLIPISIFSRMDPELHLLSTRILVEIIKLWIHEAIVPLKHFVPLPRREASKEAKRLLKKRAKQELKELKSPNNYISPSTLISMIAPWIYVISDNVSSKYIESKTVMLELITHIICARTFTKLPLHLNSKFLYYINNALYAENLMFTIPIIRYGAGLFQNDLEGCTLLIPKFIKAIDKILDPDMQNKTGIPIGGNTKKGAISLIMGISGIIYRYPNVDINDNFEFQPTNPIRLSMSNLPSSFLNSNYKKDDDNSKKKRISVLSSLGESFITNRDMSTLIELPEVQKMKDLLFHISYLYIKTINSTDLDLQIRKKALYGLQYNIIQELEIEYIKNIFEFDPLESWIQHICGLCNDNDFNISYCAITILNDLADYSGLIKFRLPDMIDFLFMGLLAIARQNIVEYTQIKTGILNDIKNEFKKNEKELINPGNQNINYYGEKKTFNRNDNLSSYTNSIRTTFTKSVRTTFNLNDSPKIKKKYKEIIIILNKLKHIFSCLNRWVMKTPDIINDKEFCEMYFEILETTLIPKLNQNQTNLLNKYLNHDEKKKNSLLDMMWNVWNVWNESTLWNEDLFDLADHTEINVLHLINSIHSFPISSSSDIVDSYKATEVTGFQNESTFQNQENFLKEIDEQNQFCLSIYNNDDIIIEKKSEDNELKPDDALYFILNDNMILTVLKASDGTSKLIVRSLIGVHSWESMFLDPESDKIDLKYIRRGAEIIEFENKDNSEYINAMKHQSIAWARSSKPTDYSYKMNFLEDPFSNITKSLPLLNVDDPSLLGGDLILREWEDIYTEYDNKLLNNPDLLKNRLEPIPIEKDTLEKKTSKLFSDIEVGSNLLKFLKKEFASESIEFVLEVKEFKYKNWQDQVIENQLNNDITISGTNKTSFILNEENNVLELKYKRRKYFKKDIEKELNEDAINHLEIIEEDKYENDDDDDDNNNNNKDDNNNNDILNHSFGYINAKKLKERKRYGFDFDPLDLPPDAYNEFYKTAVGIYDSYFKPGSDKEINIPSSIKNDIKEKIETKHITNHMFDKAVEEVIRMISRDKLHRFLTGKKEAKRLSFLEEMENFIIAEEENYINEYNYIKEHQKVDELPIPDPASMISLLDISRIILSKLSIFPLTDTYNIRILNVKNEKDWKPFLRKLVNLDKSPCREQIKAGVIYVGKGQLAEREIMLNSQPSKAFKKFTLGLAWDVNLAKHNGFNGKLDTKRMRNGKYAPYWADDEIEIVFHVVTNMPTLARDSQQIHKKRHIGNDFVQIIWSEHSRDYRPTTILSDFNDVLIIIYPLRHFDGLFRIQIFAKDGIPPFGPLQNGMIVPSKILPNLVRRTCINANRVIRDGQSGYKRPYPTRKELIEEIISSYGEEYSHTKVIGSLYQIGNKEHKKMKSSNIHPSVRLPSRITYDLLSSVLGTSSSDNMKKNIKSNKNMDILTNEANHKPFSS